MSVSRRQFLWSTAAAAVAWPHLIDAQAPDTGSDGAFRHGVASGDPLADRVILWTRVTPPASSVAPINVRWRIAGDAALARVIATGVAQTSGDRDFTVKVDAGGLQPGRQYFYVFEVDGERSPVGRTRTLPSGGVDRVRLASVCCANYPAGYFNVYRCLANRPDIDAVVHLGDYIYEFENGVYGDGTGLLRIPEPQREAVTLDDYRIRYATYRADPDLQEAHRVHPFIAVWDDHEMTNDAWSGGAVNHNPDQGEGHWKTRQAAAYRAYLEWMPIREFGDRGIRLYRHFRFGTLADLVMLDTRGLRDRQVATADTAALTKKGRTMLGAAQESWLFAQLRASQTAATAWRIIGQQVMFSRLVPPDRPVLLADGWDGYQAARERIVDFLAAERVPDVAILSGDLHSSWAFDVPRSAWSGYQFRTGEGSLAVELLAPAVSSPPLFTNPEIRARAPLLRAFLPHLKLLEGEHRGYVLLDITRQQMRSDWYYVPTVLERSPEETLGHSLVCERGSAHLVQA
jgi:alkaline phosphatase D